MLSQEDWYSIIEVEEIYSIEVFWMSELIESISRVGFEQITSKDITSTVSTENYYKAMVDIKNGIPSLTDFGKYHYSKFSERPTFFGEIKARKPL